MITIKFIGVRRLHICIERIFRYSGIEANLKVTKGPSINDVTSKSPIFDPPTPIWSLFDKVRH